jgi:hypothetical protein
VPGTHLLISQKDGEKAIGETVLSSGDAERNNNSITWNAAFFSARVYISTVWSGSFSGTGKITLLM